MSGPVPSCILHRYETQREVVATGRGCYILRPEKDNVIPRGAVVLVPLYDGDPCFIRKAMPDTTILGYASIPRHEITAAADIPGYSAASGRAAAFRVDGPPGTRGVVLVVLKLPDLHENCISCRTVHYFYAVR